MVNDVLFILLLWAASANKIHSVRVCVCVCAFNCYTVWRRVGNKDICLYFILVGHGSIAAKIPQKTRVQIVFRSFFSTELGSVSCMNE